MDGDDDEGEDEERHLGRKRRGRKRAADGSGVATVPIAKALGASSAAVANISSEKAREKGKTMVKLVIETVSNSTVRSGPVFWPGSTGGPVWSAVRTAVRLQRSDIRSVCKERQKQNSQKYPQKPKFPPINGKKRAGPRSFMV